MGVFQKVKESFEGYAEGKVKHAVEQARQEYGAGLSKVIIRMFSLLLLSTLMGLFVIFSVIAVGLYLDALALSFAILAAFFLVISLSFYFLGKKRLQLYVERKIKGA